MTEVQLQAIIALLTSVYTDDRHHGGLLSPTTRENADKVSLAIGWDMLTGGSNDDVLERGDPS